MDLRPIHNHSVNDVVDVYQKPVTKEELEGRARIVKCLDTDHYYVVEFKGEPGEMFTRFVY